MRHVALTATAIAAVLVAIVACEDQAPEKSLTAPDGVSFAKPVGGACDDGRAKAIATEQADLWAKPELDSAKDLFAPVIANCASDSTSARNYMMAYIAWTVRARGAQLTPASGGEGAALIKHWGTVFPYVGYTGTNSPASNLDTTIFYSAGAVKVIANPPVNDSAEIMTGDHRAALTLYSQNAITGDPRTHLFVIYPIPQNCLTGSNLRQYGPCYEFASYPKASPAFDPLVKVGVCQPEGANHNIGTGALGHLANGFVEIPDQQTYPSCVDAYSVAPGSWNGGFGQVLKRLAYFGKQTFGVKTAYAVHGGLGGLGGGLSPFGGVNTEVFHATFENVAAGTTPDSLSAEVGKWKPVTVTAPGSILVQSSLGNSATGNLVVLNQAGGACRQCGGLLMQGNLLIAAGGSAPTYGIYEVTFIAFQDGPTMKAATFKLRDTGNRVLGQVTFTTKSNQNLVLYNGVDTGVRWVRHQPLSFTIKVDLDQPATTAWIGTSLVADGVGFYDSNAANFANVSADFGGIDSGIMGWDEIRVLRIEDSN
jgi:hypothetical protein